MTTPHNASNVPLVILVTGASRGLGEAIAGRLSRWATVYGTTRTDRELSGCQRLALDVTDSASVQRAVDQVLSTEGRIDVLINNAGTVLSGPGESTHDSDALRQLDVNFVGAMRMTNAVLPAMRSQRSGLILNISSMAAAVPLPFRSCYAASKAALEAWAWSLRLEVKPFGIGVSCLQVGDCHTELSQQSLAEFAHRSHAAYTKPFESAYRRYCADESHGMPPANLAQRVEQIVRHPTARIRFRQTAGPLSQRLLFACRGVLPDWAIESLIAGRYLQGR